MFSSHLFTFIARTVLKDCPKCKESLDACICQPYKFPKVLTPTKKRGAQPKLSLFNLDRVRAANPARIVVVEGVFDALRLPQEAVATLGASASTTQVTLIAGLSRNRDVVLAYDPDQAGYIGAAKLAESLISMGVAPRVALLAPGVDMGDTDQVSLEKSLKRARPYVL